MIIPLNEAEKYEFSLVGGKGKQLGELISLGLNVPYGFIISTKFFNKEWSEIEDEIKSAWEQYGFESAAVRSSGNIEDSKKLSFAGLLHTELGVKKNDLEAAIKKVWFTANSYNVKSYLERNEISADTLQVAVIVQKMIVPDYSGVMFSVNPVSQDNDEIVLESVAGAGGSLVSGEETPNTYYIHKKDLVVTNSNIVEHILDKAFKESVKDQLCKSLLKVESAWKIPVDMEWAVKDDQLYILQARPITTLLSSDSQELS